MDENPYKAPQTRSNTVRACGKLLPLLLLALLSLMAYAVFKIAWDTPLPMIGK